MNIQKLMKEAQKAQRKMAEAQEKLASLSVEGSAGGGLVNVKASGDGSITGIKIDSIGYR